MLIISRLLNLNCSKLIYRFVRGNTHNILMQMLWPQLLLFPDALKDSHEIVIPNAVEKDKAPSRRNTGVDQDNMRPMDMSSRLVWDQGSREHSGPHRPHQASRERTDLNSEEGMMVYAQEAENLPGKQVIHLNEDQVTDSDSLETIVQRKATPGRANGLNGMLAPGPSKELLDWDSLEENRPAPVGNRGDTDYDGETIFKTLLKTKSKSYVLNNQRLNK